MDADRLKNLQHTRGVAWGVHLSLLCPEVIEICGHLGFEWLFLDAQHLPITPHSCRDLVCAADLAGMPCLVRVPEIRASVIEGFLNQGVLGILAPNVSSAEDARALIAAVKFSPEGKRGSAPRSRAAGYGLTQTAAEYCRRANRETFTAALIETQGGIDHLEQIMAVPGLDYIAIGPNDLGLSLGIDTGLADPRIQALVDAAQARIRLHNKPQLAVVCSAEQARSAVASGATRVAICDAALLAAAGKAFLDTLRNFR